MVHFDPVIGGNRPARLLIYELLKLLTNSISFLPSSYSLLFPRQSQASKLQGIRASAKQMDEFVQCKEGSQRDLNKVGIRRGEVPLGCGCEAQGQILFRSPKPWMKSRLSFTFCELLQAFHVI